MIVSGLKCSGMRWDLREHKILESEPSQGAHVPPNLTDLHGGVYILPLLISV